MIHFKEHYKDTDDKFPDQIEKYLKTLNLWIDKAEQLTNDLGLDKEKKSEKKSAAKEKKASKKSLKDDI